MQTFSCTQAKREFRKVLNFAEQNELVIITRYGKPIAMMIPAQNMSLEALQTGLIVMKCSSKKN